MNAVTTKAQADSLRAQLSQMEGEFKLALPDHIKPEKFRRVVLTVAQQNPDLLNADRRSLLQACLKCAADGLIPDGREAALVLYGRTVQYIPMYGGLLKRVRNSGEVASVQAHIIYENDEFVIRRGFQDTLDHRPKFPGDRGKPIGAYAVAKFKDGSDPIFEVMDLQQIEKVRLASKGANAFAWKNWWEEMARKTVFRRLSKWLPMDADLDQLWRSEDDANRPRVVTGTVIQEEPGPDYPTPPLPSTVTYERPSKLDALEPVAEVMRETETIDYETGEIVDAMEMEERSVVEEPVVEEPIAEKVEPQPEPQPMPMQELPPVTAAIDPKVLAGVRHVKDLFSKVTTEKWHQSLEADPVIKKQRAFLKKNHPDLAKEVETAITEAFQRVAQPLPLDQTPMMGVRTTPNK